MSARAAIVLSAIFLAAACEGTSPELSSEAQNHTDCQNFVSNWGTIPWGDEGLSASYEHDFETSRFTIDVQTPSKFEVEVSQKGTNRHLDLVMAVYDPSGNKIASDDDSGWGRYPRLTIDATTVGLYEVRVDPKIADTEDGGEVDFARGKFRMALECQSELCDVAAAQAFESATVDPALVTLLDTAEDIPSVCGEEDWDDSLCRSQSAYAVKYTFNSELPPTLAEAADQIKSDEYIYGYFDFNSSRDWFASNLTEFQMTIDQVDAIIGYSDYEVAQLEIEDDCSPDYCEGQWWFLHAPARGEIHAIRLGYYISSEY
jgi:Bacterial pre-peptidase C-terminal domain